VSDPTPPGGESVFAREHRTLLALFIVALGLVFAEPGHVPLFEPDEGRYAEIPREMLAIGDFVTPRLNGVLYFEKPPLFYWSVAASLAVFGQNEYAARLPSRLASAGLALMAFAFARRRWGTRAGLLAGLVTASSTLVFVLARLTIIDPMLSTALSAAAFAFAAFQEAEAGGDGTRARRALYALHGACAAAVMRKGLIGIVLPGGAIVLWIAASGRWSLVRKLFSPGPLLLFLALAVPWHVAVARRNPDFLSFYFVHEHFDRFVKNEHRRGGSILYFVAVLVAGFVPWTGFFGRFKETFPSRRSAFRERGSESFLWTFSILVFLFFSVSKSKLIPYVEPIWAPLAVLLAVGIERARIRGARFDGERRAAAILFGALLVAGGSYGLGAGTLARFGAERVGELALFALFIGFAINVSPRVFRFFRARDAVVWVAVPWAGFLVFALLILPGAAQRITPWPIASVLLRELKPGDVLVQRGSYVQAVPFYTGRTTPVSALGWHELDFGRTRPGTEGMFPSEAAFAALWNGEGRVLAVVHRDHVREFLDARSGLAPAKELARAAEGKYRLLSNRDR
jgi:4-amino-4-deoxy-L-arabinose transferase-like glycosyltransferase